MTWNDMWRYGMILNEKKYGMTCNDIEWHKWQEMICIDMEWHVMVSNDTQSNDMFHDSFSFQNWHQESFSNWQN